jgi:hypothetical protein
MMPRMKKRRSLREEALSWLQLLETVIVVTVIHVWVAKNDGLFLTTAKLVAIVVAAVLVKRAVLWLVRRFRKQS